MAVQARTNWVAQQRVDLNHLLAMESFLAFDFRTLITAFSGLVQPYILRGFQVVGQTGLSLSVGVANSLVFNPLDGNGSFYAGGASDTSVIVNLPANQQNVFVQATFTNRTQAPVNTAFWDSLALTGDSVAGTEFSASTNTQNVIILNITVNTTGFDPNAIKIARLSTNASSITSMLDARDYMWRLATGGSAPNALHRFPFSTSRGESVASGTGVGDNAGSPFQGSDTSGVRNDKGLKSQKDWMDAMMTRICEITGQTLWYDNSISSSYVTGLNINTIFFDSDAGHSYQPSSNVTILWKKNLSSQLILTSHGLSPVSWQSNYGSLEWELGGTFTSGALRTYSDVHFVSPSPVENGNLYLLLEREVQKGSGNSLSWASNAAAPALNALRAVSGVPGDFTGVAIGDYIRKQSEGYSQYYKVAKLSNGTVTTTADGTVADSTIVAVELAANIASGTSTEPLRYFRQRYSSADLVADQVSGVYNNNDVNFFWLGRRLNNIFILRGYGDLREGEETTTMLDAPVVNATGGGGGGDILLEHAYGASFAGSSYTLLQGGTTVLLTIRRRARENTAGTPSSSDNSGSLLTYTIAAPVGSIPVGSSLWVKLSNATGGALASGVVTNATDDLDNTETNTNVWEVRTAANAPLRSYDNRDVYRIATALNTTDQQGASDLQFADGTVLSTDGRIINDSLAVSGRTRFYNDNVHLMTRSAKAVLFIDETTTGRIDEDVANFFFDKSLQKFGVFNYRTGVNTFDVATAADQTWFASLGQHTLTWGAPTSTLRIRGNLEVDGTVVVSETTTVQTAEKDIVLNVGGGLSSGGGAGMEVADNAVNVVSAQPTSGQPYIDLNYSSPHGYTTGQFVGVNSNVTVGGITSGQISGTYTVFVSATSAGQAQVMSPTQLRIYTGATASDSTLVTLSPPTTRIFTFDLLSYIELADAAGGMAGMTSWAFKVKGQTQVVTLTPVPSYGISPTAHSTNMQAKRIAFVNDDNAGPAGADSTLNFSPNITWDNSTNTFAVTGTFSLTGNLDPGVDNTYNLGETNLRWKTLHVGPGSVVVHNDATDTLKVSMAFSGSVAQVVTDAATPLQMTTGSNAGLYVNTSGNVGLNTTSPQARFHIYQAAPGGSVPSNFAMLISSSNSASGRLGISNGNRVFYLDPGSTSGYAEFSTFDYGSSTPFNMVFQGNGGNIAFGTGTSPFASLVNVGNDTTNAAGGITFGSDTSLYRSGASLLRSDGTVSVGAAVVVGAATPISGATITAQLNNTDFTNTGGANSHFVMTNPNAAGMNVVSSVINGTLVGKWRSDFSGNVNYVTAAGSHIFYTGGDSGIGSEKMRLSNAGSLEIGVTNATDTIAGTDILKAVINGTTYGFSDGGGANAGFFSISNGTVSGFGGHTSNANGGMVVFGAFTNHSAVLRSGGNVDRLRVGSNGNVGIAPGIAADVASLLTLGTNTTTQAGGMLFGTDVPLYRSAATTLTLGSHFFPQTDSTWDLGSATFRWRNLNLSGALTSTGAFYTNYGTVISTTYSVSATDSYIPYNTTGGGFTITLPLANAAQKGRTLTFKDVAGQVIFTGKALTIAPTGTDTIDGVNAGLVVNYSQRPSLTFVCNGAGGWDLN